MNFEWDSEKNISNVKKHGIDFKDVTLVFDYPMLTKVDLRADYGEQRIIAMGVLNQSVLVVVFTKRKDFIRIISARRANKREKKVFYEKINK